MPKLLIFDAFTLLIPKKTVANYALLRCKTFSLKIWVCKIVDKFHVWPMFHNCGVTMSKKCTFQIIIFLFFPASLNFQPSIMKENSNQE